VGPGNAEGFQGRRHFFGAAAEAMRRLLVDQARRKQAVRHGGRRRRDELRLDELPAPDQELLGLHEVLDRLAQQDALKAELVKLRYFAGCTNEEAAGLLGLTPKSAEKHWVYARAWLQRAIQEPA
jgi:RNA polymerase sigma factor (TIGR02999 family)